MAGEAEKARNRSILLIFLPAISMLEVQLLAVNRSSRLPSRSGQHGLLPFQDDAAAVAMRGKKRSGLPGKGEAVVCRLAADTCCMPSLTGFFMPP